MFLGSVFSPYYASARRAGSADPLDFCAFNVSLNGAQRRWSMTERPRSRMARDGNFIQIGSSAVHWDGEAFNFRVSERTCPLPSALRGVVRVQPEVMPTTRFALDPGARHTWSPLAPRAHVEVTFTQPQLRWRGDAYLDSNSGAGPLEQDFSGWTWSRTALPTETTVFYEARPREGISEPLAVQFTAQGEVRQTELPTRTTLPSSRWGITRQTRSPSAVSPRLVRTLVDAPFYARSLLATPQAGREVMTIHESLDLDRFATRWVQSLLPFRMPRWPLRA